MNNGLVDVEEVKLVAVYNLISLKFRVNYTFPTMIHVVVYDA